MPQPKVSIRVGIKNPSSWFPNLGIIVIKVNSDVAMVMVSNFGKLRDEVAKLGQPEIAALLVCELR